MNIYNQTNLDIDFNPSEVIPQDDLANIESIVLTHNMLYGVSVTFHRKKGAPMTFRYMDVMQGILCSKCHIVENERTFRTINVY